MMRGNNEPTANFELKLATTLFLNRQLKSITFEQFAENPNLSHQQSCQMFQNQVWEQKPSQKVGNLKWGNNGQEKVKHSLLPKLFVQFNCPVLKVDFIVLKQTLHHITHASL